MKVIKLAILSAVIGLALAGCGSTTPATNQSTNAPAAKASPATNTSPGNVVSTQQQQSSSGKELYAENCQICHKDNGTGGKVTIEAKNLKVENLTEDKLKKASDEKLMGYIQDGVPDEGMPAFGDKLRDEEIKLIVAHIRTLQK